MEGLHVITYVRRMEGNDIYFQLQIKCILENYKSKYVENMIVVGKGIEETFQRMEFERIEGKKLILIDDDDDNITFQDLFYIANQIFENQKYDSVYEVYLGMNVFRDFDLMDFFAPTNKLGNQEQLKQNLQRLL
jgi:hypothetical protein